MSEPSKKSVFGIVLDQLTIRKNLGTPRSAFVGFDSSPSTSNRAAPRTIDRWRSGERNPSVEDAPTIDALAAKLNLSNPEHSLLLAAANIPQNIRATRQETLTSAEDLLKEIDPTKHDQRELLNSWITNELQRMEFPESVGPDDNATSLRLAGHIDRKTKHFVGRRHIFEQITEFLRDAQDSSSGRYIVITGKPGVGKSALMAQLFKEPHRANITVPPGCIYFPIGGEAPNTILENICTQIIRKYRLEYQVSPNDIRDENILNNLLTQVSERSSREEPLVLLIDGLDEIQGAQAPVTNTNTLFLPRFLPSHVFIIVTYRSGADYVRLVYCDVPKETINLDDNLEKNCQDITDYIREQYIKNAGFKHPEEELIQAIAGRGNGDYGTSEGNFLYVEYVLRALQPGGLFDDLDDLKKLPQGLEEYYERYWTKMETLIPGDKWEQYKRVIASLVDQKTPVSEERIKTWTGLSENAISEAIRRWGEFLSWSTKDVKVGDSFKKRNAYQIYHWSFRDFLGEKYDINKIEQEKIASATYK